MGHGSQERLLADILRLLMAAGEGAGEAQARCVVKVIKLSQEIEGVLPCIDFSHLHAREGKVNTYD